jgi:hypothetical protein
MRNMLIPRAPSRRSAPVPASRGGDDVSHLVSPGCGG